MRTIKILFFSVILISGLSLACKHNDQPDTKEVITSAEELSGSEIVERSCRVHGGMDFWNRLKTLEFSKSTKLLFADGNVESDITQKQSFTFNPRQVYRISYKTDTTTVSMIYDEGYIHKRVNGFPVNDTLEIESARSALLAAQFVVSQPFALLDAGVELDRIEDLNFEGKTYFAVEATYPGDGPDSDKWTYYFDQDDFTLVYNKV
ncbi:MAG: hypothetical protein HKO90_05400, partial [Flavobacteriaceae bacterium]|nr:hypothetical protein [Flavobacteriaceae bacterium]